METKTIEILPTSFDPTRAYFTIPGGQFKYLTKKIRLSDFSILNLEEKPVYFGPAGIYSIIKSIQFINQMGNIIDACYNSDYLAIKLAHANNGQQRDVNRYLFQNAGVSIDASSMGQVALDEMQGRQDATKLAGYIDLSFMSDYLTQRSVSDDFMTIQIEFQPSTFISGGYTLSRAPSLYLDEVLSPMPVDQNDIILYDMIVPDKLIVKGLNAEDGPKDPSALILSAIDQRMNSYTNQLISNLYVYSLETTENGQPLTNGYAKSELSEGINLLIDGKQLMPYGGLRTDAMRLASLSDNSGPISLPSAASYYARLGTQFAPEHPIGLDNPNTGKHLASVYGYTAIGVNQVVLGELSVQFQAKMFKRAGVAESNKFVQLLAEVKRFYKRSNGTTGNYAPMPSAM